MPRTIPDFDTYNDKSNTNCGVRIIAFGCLAAILICVINESRIKQILECELTSFPIALVHVITLVIVPFFLVMRSYRSTDDSVLDNRIFFLKHGLHYVALAIIHSLFVHFTLELWYGKKSNLWARALFELSTYSVFGACVFLWITLTKTIARSMICIHSEVRDAHSSISKTNRSV